jgi:hypothetical protein
MRALILGGILALISLTPAYAPPNPNAGSLGRTCSFECNLRPGTLGSRSPQEQACVRKCMATKKAAQH